MKKVSLFSLLLVFLLLSGCQNQENNFTSPRTQVNENKDSALIDSTLTAEDQESDFEVEVDIFSEGGLGITYIVHSSKGTLMVDNGFYNDELETYLKANGGVDAVLLTHGHYDHIGGIDTLKQSFPDAEIYINELDNKLLTDIGLNYSSSMMEPVIVNSKVSFLNEGVYELAGFQVEVIHFGGHTAGSNFYYLPEENLMFTGDAILPESVGPVRATGSNEEMQKSVCKLLERTFPDDMRVLCGHNGDTTFAELLQNNHKLIESK